MKWGCSEVLGVVLATRRTAETWVHETRLHMLMDPDDPSEYRVYVASGDSSGGSAGHTGPARLQYDPAWHPKADRLNQQPQHKESELEVVFLDRLYCCPTCGYVYQDDAAGVPQFIADFQWSGMTGKKTLAREEFKREWMKVATANKDTLAFYYRRCEECRTATAEELYGRNGIIHNRVTTDIRPMFLTPADIASAHKYIEVKAQCHGLEYWMHQRQEECAERSVLRRLRRHKCRITKHEQRFFSMLLGAHRVKELLTGGSR